MRSREIAFVTMVDLDQPPKKPPFLTFLLERLSLSVRFGVTAGMPVLRTAGQQPAASGWLAAAGGTTAGGGHRAVLNTY